MQVAGQRRGLCGDAFHQIAVAHQSPGAVINRPVACLVVARRQVCFGNRHAHRIRQALTKRAGGDFHARRVATFRVAGRLAAPWRNRFSSSSGRS